MVNAEGVVAGAKAAAVATVASAIPTVRSIEYTCIIGCFD